MKNGLRYAASTGPTFSLENCPQLPRDTGDFVMSIILARYRSARSWGVVAMLRHLRAGTPGVADTGPDARLSLSAATPGENAALDHWRLVENRDTMNG